MLLWHFVSGPNTQMQKRMKLKSSSLTSVWPKLVLLSFFFLPSFLPSFSIIFFLLVFLLLLFFFLIIFLDVDRLRNLVRPSKLGLVCPELFKYYMTALEYHASSPEMQPLLTMCDSWRKKREGFRVLYY